MTDTVSVGPASATEPGDEAAQQRELAAFWINELSDYEKAYNRWTLRGRKIVKKYRDERFEQYQDGSSSSRRYCILWSNVETIKPAIFARPPKAVAQRRWKDRDPVGRVSAMILERAANFSIDCYDLTSMIKTAVIDYLLVGRGTSWTRYEPTINTQTDDQGNKTDELSYEKVATDHVAWEDFAHSVSRTWPEVWWVSRYTYQTRKQLVERFGEQIGNAIPLDWGPERNAVSGKFEKRNKARIAEIWSKRDRKVYFISRAYGDRPLEVRDPMYKLTDFFPCPRPCYATTTTESLIPVPDYVYYQDQAEEIDDLTQRIGKLTDALKLVGIYAGDEQAMLSQLLSPQTDMKMIPVENWAMMRDKNGVQGIIDWFPVEQVIKVLDGCISLRTQLIQDIYQITGISDIVRGATDPNETATAQQIKGQWGGLRIRDRQSDIQRFARDIIRIESEIVAQLFQPQTLSAMTGVELPTEADKQAAQMQVQQMQAAAKQAAMMQQLQAARAGAMNGAGPAGAAPLAGPPSGPPTTAAGGAPGVPAVPGSAADQGPPAGPAQPEIPEDLQRVLDTPSWEEVTALLRNNELRDFKIDIETDSTIQPDEQAEKEARTELLTSVGSFFQNSLPMLQTFPQLAPMLGELVLFAVRGFRTGAAVEDSVEEAMQNVLKAALEPKSPPPDPLVIKAETQAKISEAQAQQEMQHKGMFADADIQIKKALAATDIEIMRAKGGADIENKTAAVGADIENKGAANEAAIGNKTAATQAAIGAKQSAAKPNGGGAKRIQFERGPDGKISGATVTEGGAPDGATLQ